MTASDHGSGCFTNSSWCKPTTSQNQCIKRYSRALQWMPRRILPMKDVEDCDKLRVAVNKLLSGDLRIGKPSMSNVMLPATEYIGCVVGTN